MTLAQMITKIVDDSKADRRRARQLDMAAAAACDEHGYHGVARALRARHAKAPVVIDVDVEPTQVDRQFDRSDA